MAKKGEAFITYRVHNPAPTFELQKGDLDKMANRVMILSKSAHGVPIFLGRNNRRHVPTGCLCENGLGIIRFVPEKRMSLKPFHEACKQGAIRHLTSCNKHSEQQTMRIYGQKNFGVAPFCAPHASLPLHPLAACGCPFT